MTPAPWIPSTHPTEIYSLNPVKMVKLADYERARMCVNALAGIPDETLICLKPGEIKQLLAKKKPPAPSLFERGDDAPSSAHKLAIACFCGLWEELYSVKYRFHGAKEGALVKGILRHINNDDHLFERIVRRYLADRDRFVTDSRHSLGLLSSQLNKYLADPVETEAEAPKSKIAEQTEKLRAKLRSKT